MGQVAHCWRYRAAIVRVVTAEDAREARLTSVAVARLLGLGQSTVLRIPREKLDYWETPGGGLRRHRRYRRQDVEEYARTVLGRELPASG